jgi:toxin CcdB
MARFSVYKNPESDGCLIDIQADLLSHLNTRVVVPLLSTKTAPKGAETLNPVFDIEGQPFVMVTQFMAAVPVQILKHPLLTFGSQRQEITAALDLLFQGF